MKKLLDSLTKHRRLMLDALDYIWKHPETGYREVKTSAYLESAFEALGYTLTRAEGITGFTAELDTGRPGPTVLLLGELDSVICFEHPECNKTTGAVHSCGHCAQTAALLGIAAALREEGALDGLCGKIRLCAVPAEELCEIEYRKALINRGIISYMGGKVEFLKRGLFDGCDIAMMIHTTTGDHSYVDAGRYVGCLPKKVTYKGVAAHAGTSPHCGVNALYAATLGLQAINSIRETFRNEDYVRVHPIVTSGGDIVNTIPDTVTIESYVRGLDFASIEQANNRVNRALVGAALALGANVEIEDNPGYAPCVYDRRFAELALQAGREALPDVTFTLSERISAGSSDIGDLTMLMPCIQPSMMGAKGTGHGADYYVTDPDLAVVGAAKWQLAMLHHLLRDSAAAARSIIAAYTPAFPSKEAYFDFLRRFECSGNRLDYSTPTSVTATL